MLTAAYEENSCVDIPGDVITVKTGNSAATMRKVLPSIVNLIQKMATGAEILGPAEENYHERGIRVNYLRKREDPLKSD